jgi:hypothetical protein
MGIEYDLNNETSTDLLNDYSENNKADYGGDLAVDTGVDLNSSDNKSNQENIELSKTGIGIAEQAPREPEYGDNDE